MVFVPIVCVTMPGTRGSISHRNKSEAVHEINTLTPKALAKIILLGCSASFVWFVFLLSWFFFVLFFQCFHPKCLFGRNGEPVVDWGLML